MSRHASGLMAWLMQRATAVYLAFAALYLVWFVSVDPPADHAALVAWISQPLVRLGVLLAVPLLVAHSWVGVRNVLMDYIHPLWLRLALLLLGGGLVLASGLWLMWVVMIASFFDV